MSARGLGLLLMLPLVTACSDPSSDEASSGGKGGGGGSGGVDAGTSSGGTSGGERLGAYLDDAGDLHVRVRSLHAERIELWLYREPFGADEVAKIVLNQESDAFAAIVNREKLSDLGLIGPVHYGYRAWGPNWHHDPSWKPGSEVGFVSDVDASGNRFNPNKLLGDPYARELSHDPSHAEQSGWKPYTSGPEQRKTDTGSIAPKGIALDTSLRTPGARPSRKLRDQVIYEVHVRGLTMNDPSVPEALRGTFAGAALKAPYLSELGVTAIELLPLHETQNDQNDVDPNSAAGDNYWGYSSLSFFAPDRRYASDRTPGGPTRELAAMVDAFHAAGISVFVDVVYNHTAEGSAWDPEGRVTPLLSWRGIDNASYYQLGKQPAFFQNDNGVGANLAAHATLARDLVIDSLRYWYEELGVDGFRFDLAPILANGCVAGCYEFDGGDSAGILLRARNELPGAILIAEPWGTGAGTYQVGNFPSGWAEWNDKFRDLIRADQNRLGLVDVTPGWLANRLSGSFELFGDDGRKPWHSINFITAHDGLTLRDVYACDDKNNSQAWPFGPSDGGSDNNLAWDQNGNATNQRRAARTGLALLMLSAGVPMIAGGDEMYRTQRCNNNAYNLDSVGIWLDWSNLEQYASFHRFAQRLIQFRSAHPALRPDDFRPTDDLDGDGRPRVAWYRSNGQTADAAYLDSPSNHFLAYQLDGKEVDDPARAIFIAYNGHSSGVSVTLPPEASGHEWRLVADTHEWLEPEDNFPSEDKPLPDGAYLLGARSVLILVEK